MKISIINDNTLLTVKTDCTLADIQSVATHKPDALSIMDHDGNPTFTIGITKTGAGSINAKGAEFASVPANDGKAKITICLPAVEDPAEYVAEQYTAALTNIQTIEGQVRAAVTAIASQKNTIKQMIHIVTE